MKGTSRTHWRT